MIYLYLDAHTREIVERLLKAQINTDKKGDIR